MRNNQNQAQAKNTVGRGRERGDVGVALKLRARWDRVLEHPAVAVPDTGDAGVSDELVVLRAPERDGLAHQHARKVGDGLSYAPNLDTPQAESMPSARHIEQRGTCHRAQYDVSGVCFVEPSENPGSNMTSLYLEPLGGGHGVGNRGVREAAQRSAGWDCTARPRPRGLRVEVLRGGVADSDGAGPGRHEAGVAADLSLNA